MATVSKYAMQLGKYPPLFSFTLVNNHLLIYPLNSSALKVRCDWLLKLKISFAIHLHATHVGFLTEKFVIIAFINELKTSFCGILSHCFST